MALDVAGFDLSFNLDNPEAIAAAEDLTNELVAVLSDDSAAAIREILRRAFVEGIPPYDAAVLIEDAIGLNAIQANALANYMAGLQAAGYAPDDIESMVSDYSDRLLQDRAEMIARTETIRAAADGQEALWSQAADIGLINPDRTRRKWIATDDERTCHDCMDMDGEETALDEPFDGPDGPTDGPPLHPNCRCAEGLVFDDIAGASGDESQVVLDEEAM